MPAFWACFPCVMMFMPTWSASTLSFFLTFSWFPLRYDVHATSWAGSLWVLFMFMTPVDLSPFVLLCSCPPVELAPLEFFMFMPPCWTSSPWIVMSMPTFWAGSPWVVILMPTRVHWFLLTRKWMLNLNLRHFYRKKNFFCILNRSGHVWLQSSKKVLIRAILDFFQNYFLKTC